MLTAGRLELLGKAVMDIDTLSGEAGIDELLAGGSARAPAILIFTDEEELYPDTLLRELEEDEVGVEDILEMKPLLLSGITVPRGNGGGLSAAWRPRSWYLGVSW